MISLARVLFFTSAFLFTGIAPFAHAQNRLKTLRFGGYEWEVRESKHEGPGPNDWNADNVRVDNKGALHLKITRHAGQWTCAEITSKRKFGFGTYQFNLVGRIDRLDPNLVLGLFNYPTPDLGKDGTNEIDIEFAHWGNSKFPIGNYTVWPAKSGIAQSSKTFDFSLASLKANKSETVQRFLWKKDEIRFQSFAGSPEKNTVPFGDYLFKPENPTEAIPQHPLPVHLNLWLFKGLPPTNGSEVEIVVTKFVFLP